MIPFKYGVFVTGTDFCGRKKELDLLSEYIASLLKSRKKFAHTIPYAGLRKQRQIPTDSFIIDCQLFLIFRSSDADFRKQRGRIFIIHF